MLKAIAFLLPLYPSITINLFSTYVALFLLKIGIDTYTLLYIKQMTNKDLLYSTGNSIQYSTVPMWEKNLKQSEHMYMFMYMYN